MEKQRIKIGWASCDVTPDKPAVLAGQFYGRIARRVNDPVTATALALSGDDERPGAISVSLDAVSFRPYSLECLRARLAEVCPEIDPQWVFVNCTHTHSAPVQHPSWYPMPPECIAAEAYSELLGERIAAIVAEAWRNRRAGSVAWGLSHAGIGRNRHATYADGSVQMYGPTRVETFVGFENGEESLVQTLFTFDDAGELTGAAVNVACPSQCTEHSDYVTADYWCEARAEMRSRLGEGLFILPQCAAAGDISPHLLAYQEAERRMLRLRGLLDDEGMTDAEAENEARMARRRELGLRIAGAVDEALAAALADRREQVEFAHAWSILDLPRQLVSQAQRDAAAAEAASHRDKLAGRPADPADHDFSFHSQQAGYYQSVVDRYENQRANPTAAMELHVLRIGEVAIATNSFELYHEYEIRMRGRSAALQTFVVQLASSGGVGSYLPSPRAMGGNSYGAKITSSQVGPEGGNVLVAETLKTIESLFA